MVSDTIEKAVRLLERGKPIFIHDFSHREDEVDMVYYGPRVTASSVTTLRTMAGGLICYVTSLEVGRALGLKFFHEILAEAGYRDLAGKPLSYGDLPSFSLWVNYVGVKTGIRDADRAVTIRKLDELVGLVNSGRVSEARRRFFKEFTSPGHVPILLGRDLRERKGHTELALALTTLGGLRPSVVIAEVLSGEGAMSVEEVRGRAEEIGTVVVEAEEIIEAWEGRSET